ncbi:MAG: hypothetical protein H6741_13800 [Alphaproteobacteria bacterium]|nr:hypothetical protein [Alphaproteobacteria bacterium]
MSDQALTQVIAFAAMIFAAVGLVAMRWIMFSRDSRDAVKQLDEPIQPRFRDPKESLSRASSRLVDSPASSGRVSNYGSTTAHGATPRAPRLAQLTKVDPEFSELDFLAFVEALYAWATKLRPKRDYLGLSAFLADPAKDTFLSGINDLDSVSDIHVGVVRPVRVYADSDWSSAEVEIQASMVERVKDEFQQVYRTESWRFRRRSSVKSLDRERLLSLGCPHCGSKAPIGERGECMDCDKPRGGPEVHWEVAGIANTRRNPQPSPPRGLPLGPPGYPAPNDPDIAEKENAWEQARPENSLSELKEAMEGWLRRVLSVEGPTLTGPLGHRLAWEQRLMADAGIQRKVSAGKIRFMELMDITEDATHEFIEGRLSLDVMLWMEDGKTVPPTAPPKREVELTLARPKQGEGEWYPVDMRWNSDDEDETKF